MDIGFPIIACIFVSSAVICCCIRHRYRSPEPDLPLYIAIPQQTEFLHAQSKPPSPTAPPLQTIYELNEEGDPIV